MLTEINSRAVQCGQAEARNRRAQSRGVREVDAIRILHGWLVVRAGERTANETPRVFDANQQTQEMLLDG